MLTITLKPLASVRVGEAIIHNNERRPIQISIDAPDAVKVVRSDAKKRAA